MHRFHWKVIIPTTGSMLAAIIFPCNSILIDMANYFYTDFNGQRQGPVDDQQLKELAASGVITPQTSLETDTGHQGTAGQIPGLFAAPFAVATAPGGSMGTPQAVTPLSQSFNTCFMWYWICLAAAIPTCGLAGIGAAVFMYILLYKCWKLIPPDIARTTPGKAVGFCFIPIFNIYWIFVAVWGLGKDMNKALQRQGVPFEVNETLGLMCCILPFCTVIPLLNLLVAVGLLVCMIIYLKSLKDAAVALIEQGR